jgi:hypothetical protein
MFFSDVRVYLTSLKDKDKRKLELLYKMIELLIETFKRKILHLLNVIFSIFY